MKLAFLAVLGLTLADAGSAEAQFRGSRRPVSVSVTGSSCHGPVCAAPAAVVQSYTPVYQQAVVQQVQYVPVAVYAVPGPPTATINVYPGQFNLLQVPPPINVTVNVAAPEVKK